MLLAKLAVEKRQESLKKIQAYAESVFSDFLYTTALVVFTKVGERSTSAMI